MNTSSLSEIFSIETKSESETENLALDFIKKINKGDVIGLEGELGTGKTTFVRGFAGGFGIDKRDVDSPTFKIVNVYRKDSLVINHVDLYRLGEKNDIEDLGLDNLIDENAITIIEWADKLSESDLQFDFYISITYLDDTARMFRFYSNRNKNCNNY